MQWLEITDIVVLILYSCPHYPPPLFQGSLPWPIFLCNCGPFLCLLFQYTSSPNEVVFPFATFRVKKYYRQTACMENTTYLLRTCFIFFLHHPLPYFKPTKIQKVLQTDSMYGKYYIHLLRTCFTFFFCTFPSPSLNSLKYWWTLRPWGSVYL